MPQFIFEHTVVRRQRLNCSFHIFGKRLDCDARLGCAPVSWHCGKLTAVVTNRLMLFKYKARWLTPVPMLFVLFALVVQGKAARADCTDPPQPKVDWRRCYQDSRNLAGAELAGAELRDATFMRANLENADFRKVDAFRAKFYSARLQGATFDEARLAEADFTEANLSGASFRGADLRGARMFGADLRDADLTDANLRGTDFFRAQLAGALWTDGKTRCAPGSIGQCR